MKDPDSHNAVDDFTEALRKPDMRQYQLCLYVTGSTPQSARAIVNITQVCEQYLHGHYDLEVIDIYQQPDLARVEQIIAAPTLIKKLPLPLRKLIGNMSNRERVLNGLDLGPQLGDAAAGAAGSS